MRNSPVTSILSILPFAPMSFFFGYFSSSISFFPLLFVCQVVTKRVTVIGVHLSATGEPQNDSRPLFEQFNVYAPERAIPKEVETVGGGVG